MVEGGENATDAPGVTRVAGLIAQVMRGHDVRTLVPLGGGADHWAFDVDGTFVARLRKQRDEQTAADIEREAALLEFAARVSPLPVPEVVAAAPAHGFLVLRRLSGTSLFDEPPSDRQRLVAPLAEFLRRIHGVPSGEVAHLVARDDYGHSAFLADAVVHMTEAGSSLQDDQRRAVELFLVAPPPPESSVRVFCHNDLGAEHLLASDDARVLTGVIDWSDAALTDPARDLGRLLRDLGPQAARGIVRAYAGAAEASLWARALFIARCALLEDLAYGLGTSHRRYADHALARLPALFDVRL